MKIDKSEWLMEEELESIEMLKKRGNPLNRSKLSSRELEEYFLKA